MKTLTTLEEAIDYVFERVSAEQKATIMPGAPRSDMNIDDRAVRNSLGLWQDNALTRHFKDRFGLGHADDMSGLIVDGAWAKMGGEPFDLDKEVARYKAHWTRQGIDPLTQERVGPAQEKNGGGIDWSAVDIPNATIRRRAPEPKQGFWAKLGDLIYGKR